MASRVNTKFVAILAGAMVLLTGAAGFAAWYSINHRGDSLVAKGDALFAEKKYAEASALYAKAVNKDNTRIDWLKKWQAALVEEIPENSSQMSEKYRFYITTLRKLAQLQPTDAEAQRTYLMELADSRREARNSRPAMEDLIKEVTEFTSRLDPASPETKKLLGQRGIAQTMIMARGVTDEKARAQALADLKAAAEADPSNSEFALFIATWHQAEAERARQSNLEPEALEQIELAKAAVRSFLERNPKDIDGLLAISAIESSEKLRKATALQDTKAIMREAQAEAARIIGLASEADPAALSADVLSRLLDRARVVNARDLYEPVRGLIARAAEANPDDFVLRELLGSTLRELDRYDEAIAEYQKIVDMPKQKVGRRGMELPTAQLRALAGQSEAALAKAQALGITDEASKAAVAQARQYRDKLNDLAGAANKDAVKLIDAKIALFDRQFAVAVANLSALRSEGRYGTGRGRHEVLAYLAMALEGMKDLGEARRVLEERLSLPNMSDDPWTLARLAEIHVQLDDPAKAAMIYRRLIELEPENEGFKARLRSIQTAQGVASGSGADADPLIAAIIEARKQRDTKNFDAARTILAGLAKDHPAEYRVIRERAELEMIAGDRAAALKVIEEGLAALPDDRRLKVLKVQAEIEDPVKAMETIIAEGEGTAVQKLLARADLYLKHNRPEDAAKVLAEAEQLAPDEPGVIETAFVHALARGDLERARQLVPRAARVNADQVNGLLFQGRLQFVEGKSREAVETFTQVTQKIPNLPLAWRFLGQSYMMAGRPNEAVEALKRSLEGRPNDVEAIKAYVGALNRVGRCVEALAALDPEKGGGLKYAPDDEGLMRLWLDLEGRCGDKEEAIRRRVVFLDARPGDMDNVAALTQLYLERGRFAEASGVIDAYVKSPEPNPLLVTLLRANVAAKQGKLADGIRLFQDHLASTPREKQTARDYLAYAQYLIDNARPDEAFAVLKLGRDLQDPKDRSIDRRMGDYAFESGGTALQQWEILKDRAESEDVDADTRAAAAAQIEPTRAKAMQYLADAATAYESVIEGGGAEDPERLVQKRLAETYQRLERWSDSARVLNDLSKTLTRDLQVLLLRSNQAEKQGDRREARKLLDQAVEQFPDQFLPFMRRAFFNLPDKNLAGDVIQDLETALRFDPTNLSARQMLFNLQVERGQQEAAFASLKKGVDANPSNDSMRLMLLTELIKAGRIDEASQEALAAVRIRPDDERWANATASLLLRVRRYCEAAELYGVVHQRLKMPRTAGKYLSALLQCTRPKTPADVRRLLDEFSKGASAEDTSDLMLQSRALWFLDKRDDAIAKAFAAYKVCGQDAQCLQQWFDQIVVITESFKAAEKVIRDLGKQETLPDFLNVMLMAVEIGDLKTTDDRVREMIKACEEYLAKPDQHVVTRFRGNALLSRAHYKLGNIDGAIEASKEALKANARDLEMNNNLAFLLANDKNDPKAALPYAERAVQLAPKASPALDTLGWVYYQLGDYKKAEEHLERAVLHARPDRDDEAIAATIHLGRARVKLNDISGARQSLADAQKLAKKSPEAGLLYGKDLEALRKETE